VNPVVTIAGAITNPVIANVTTGQTLGLTMAIGTGESVVVDCERFKATKAGVSVVSALGEAFLAAASPWHRASTPSQSRAQVRQNAQIAWTPRYY